MIHFLLKNIQNVTDKAKAPFGFHLIPGLFLFDLVYPSRLVGKYF